MQLLQWTGEFSLRAQELAFLLSLVITGLFLSEYRRYEEEQKKQDALDHFLND